MIGIAAAVLLATTGLYLNWTRRVSPLGAGVGAVALVLAAQGEHAVLALIRAAKDPAVWIFPFIAVAMPLIEESARFTATRLMSGALGGLFASLVSVSLGVSAAETVYKLRFYADPDLSGLDGVARLACSAFSSGLLHLLVALVVARRIESVPLRLSWLLALVVHAFYNAAVDTAFTLLQARGMDAELILSPLVIAALLALVLVLTARDRAFRSTGRSEPPAPGGQAGGALHR